MTPRLGLRTPRLLWTGLLLAVGVASACQEDFAAPGVCPEFCPEGELEIIDTVIFPVTGDASFRGFISGWNAASIHVVDRPTLRSRAVIEFEALPDSAVPKGDTTNTVYEIVRVDSVRLTVTLLERDTTGSGLELSVFQLPPGRDTIDTYAALDAEFAAANLRGTIAVDDQVSGLSGTLSTLLSGVTLDDTGVLALGLDVAAATGMPTASLRSLNDPAGIGEQIIALFFAVVDSLGTETRAEVSRRPTFDTSLLQTSLTGTTDLEVGGIPSARTFLPLPIPESIIDSSTIVRAVLRLVPTAPAEGTTGVTFRLVARPLLADLGRKSPVSGDSTSTLIEVGSQDTITLDIGDITQLWKANTDRPRVVMLRTEPEGGSLGQLRFGGSATVGAVPSLQVVFFRPFDFGSP